MGLDCDRDVPRRAAPERITLLAANNRALESGDSEDELIHRRCVASSFHVVDWSLTSLQLPSAPNITGAIVLLILAFSSDFAHIRFPFIALGFALPVIGACRP